METRKEIDSLGVKSIPSSAYYGINALRGKENFPISGFTSAHMYPESIKVIGWIKKAAAKTNMELGAFDPSNPLLNEEVGKAIMQATDELIEGKFNNQFIVDVYQGGTGTSFHMNANEIIANRATEIVGGKKGEYKIHPNDHVNYGQSTNDVIPTAIRLTILVMHEGFMTNMTGLIKALQNKSIEFANIIIPGRTHMQDAIPLTLEQVFGAFADSINDAGNYVETAALKLHEIGLGATAVGTGLNSAPGYRDLVIKNLSAISGIDLKPVCNYFQYTSSFGSIAAYSAALRGVAIELEKISHDLKFYSSGPCSAIAEIKLPPLQAGSSIMPGKVNPVLPELINQISYAVQGNDLSVSLAAQNGQLQLNVMMPLILLKITDSVRLLTNGLKVFAERCITGIEENHSSIEEHLQKSAVLITALNPYIGYEAASQIAKKATQSGKTIYEIILEEQITDKNNQPITEEILYKILSAKAMTEPDS